MSQPMQSFTQAKAIEAKRQFERQNQRHARLLSRSDDDIMDRLDKQFSKRARRIKAAKQAGLLP